MNNKYLKRSSRFVFCLFCLLYSFELPSSGEIVDWTSLDVSLEEERALEDLEQLTIPNSNLENALHRFRRSVLKARIMEAHGRSITRSVLEAEARRIQFKTLAPEKLQNIQRIFLGNFDLYLRVYVMPVYVERELPYGLFPYNAEIHSEVRALAQKSLDEALQKKIPLKQLEHENGDFRFESISLIEKADDSLTSQTKAQSETTEEFRKLRNNFLSNEIADRLPEAAVFPRLLETELEFCVIEKADNDKLNQLCVKKKEYGEWLDEELAKVSP